MLQLSTPVAYQQALNNTEQWVASRSSKASTDPLGTRSNTSDSASNAPRESDNVALATDCDPENEASALSDDNMSPNTQTYVSDNNASVIGVKDDITDGSGTAQGKGLLDRMKILGTKMFTGTGANNSSNDNTCGSHGYYKSKWAHESMLESDSMCLWSSPGEVVPFISSSSRTALPPFESIQYHFQEGVIAVRKSKTDESKESKEDEKENILKISRGKMTFPPLLQLCFSNSDVEDSLGESAPGVIYFGIDCRNERERTLGLFPRVRYFFIEFLISLKWLYAVK